jgi:hypothetical protein
MLNLTDNRCLPNQPKLLTKAIWEVLSLFWIWTFALYSWNYMPIYCFSGQIAFLFEYSRISQHYSFTPCRIRTR